MFAERQRDRRHLQSCRSRSPAPARSRRRARRSGPAGRSAPRPSHSRSASRVGERQSIGHLGVGDPEQGETQGHLERGRGGQSRTARYGSLNPQTRAGQTSSGRLQLGDGTAGERSPAAGRLRRIEREAVVTAQVDGDDVDHAPPAGRARHGHALADREGQREAAVVIGVLPDQVDSAGANAVTCSATQYPPAQHDGRLSLSAPASETRLVSLRRRILSMASANGTFMSRCASPEATTVAGGDASAPASGPGEPGDG